MRRPLLLVLLASIAPGACSTPLPPTDAVQIRVANDSDTAFDYVRVVFPSGEEEYGAVGARRATSYREVERAYRYAWVEVRFGADRVVLQPIDYVGEALLTPGYYTYVLGLDPTGPDLILELRRDD